MKVLDTSVVAKWYIYEDGSEAALQLEYGFAAREFDIVVPDIILYELANCIRFSSNKTDKDVIDVLENFDSLGIDIITPTQSLLKSAAKLSFKYQTSIYDAAYLALAKAIGGELITADKKFYEKVKDERGVRLL